MRVLVTGAAGVLGRQVLPWLQEQGSRVCAIDNFRTSDRAALDQFPGVEWFEGSVSDKTTVSTIVRDFRPTHVVHLAASYADPNDLLTDFTVNSYGTAVVVEACLALNVERFIYVQTVLCYGSGSTTPIPVSAPLKPRGGYAVSKVAGELYVCTSGLPYASLRLGSVLSAGMTSGPLPAFYTALSRGQSPRVAATVRDYVTPDDFREALRRLMETSAPTGTFNVSTGVGVSTLELFNHVSRHLGSNIQPVLVNPRADDTAIVILDPAETTRQLGWRAEGSLSDAIDQCLLYYDRFGVGPIYSHLKR